MARDDWFRSKQWNAEVGAVFDAKLARARDKAQYLRIQACTLASSEPDIALNLLRRYFALGEHFDIAQAYMDEATAYLAKGCLSEAVVAYESAPGREQTHPHTLTQACLELPWLVATRRLKAYYDRALEVLEQYKGRVMFPVDRYRWNAAKALILADRGLSLDVVRECARAALDASTQASSGLRYHPNVGSVEASHREITDELEKLAN